ncbi:HTH domain-containing protein [Acinetobacter qingfengensis]|uniref:DNA-binding protein n=1 Tax=Acinetobacter qingfengensis TaxID=1262585 RepID=A0A1E7R8U5_9GAMM|nr:HTH domain-containing protein [Acinetobacter qingfengensis]KAA8735552.1 HTH domain-containing protein [Acinetobacter qingfengensis]OEY95800.1 DNA-binding protein [Acinetobacter qingfengensis]
MAEYIAVLESDTPPQILLGQNIGGAVVTELKQKKQELVSAAYLAGIYSISTDTVRRKLESINQGSDGKCLYNPVLAATILKQGDKNKRGRKRAN